MRRHREHKRLPYKPDQVFDLVADIERYPDFLPWCEALKVLSRETSGHTELLVAEMTVGFNVYRERFKTEVTLDRAARRISIRYLKGPFKRLENDWRFEPDGEGTRVDFDIAYEFRSPALQMLVGFFFEEALRRLVAAFDARAAALYGKPRRPARRGIS
ncbi:MAG: type II toxin-antitoxin system RatA family toxin [Alphaproteobacteria bacterium]